MADTIPMPPKTKDDLIHIVARHLCEAEDRPIPEDVSAFHALAEAALDALEWCQLAPWSDWPLDADAEYAAAQEANGWGDEPGVHEGIGEAQ